MLGASPFVNRSQELQALEALLDSIVGHDGLRGGAYLPECVVNVYGAPGIGKSSLLHELRHRWATRQVQLIFVNLHERDLIEAATSEKVHFCRVTLQQLALGEAQNTQLCERLDRVAATDSDGIDAIAADLVATLQERAAQSIVVLMVDACEQASDAFFAWIERRVILPLIHDPREETTRSLFILASQLLLRWRQHNVRRRVKVEELGPLNPKATEDQVGDADLGALLYDLTFGHPLSTSVAFAQVPVELTAHERMRWVAEHKYLLSTEIVQRLQQHAVRSMHTPRTAPERWQTWEVWTILEAISVLREFDVNSMRVILSAYDAKYSAKSQSMLLINIRDLLETRFAEWSSAKRAYQVAAAIRRIFASALALRNEERYTTLRKRAIEYYQQQIQTVAGNRHVYIVEYFFQLMSDPELDATALDGLPQRLTSLLVNYYTNQDRSFYHRDALAQLAQAFASDDELKNLLALHGYAEDLLATTVLQFCPLL